MYAPSYFQFPQRWTSQDLADAVPLRLHEMFDFDADRDGIEAAANSVPRARLTHGYLRVGELSPMFRVR